MSKEPGRKFDVEIWADGENKSALSAADRVLILAEALAAEIADAPLGENLPLNTAAVIFKDAVNSRIARLKALLAQFRGVAQ